MSLLQKKFTFARIRYQSGNWDTDERMPLNLLNSLVEYTSVPINPQEKIVNLAQEEIFNHPFCYLSGHRLVQFQAAERKNFEMYVRNGGFVFADDCNHDIDGLFAQSFERQMAEIFGRSALQKSRPNTTSTIAFLILKRGRPPLPSS